MILDNFPAAGMSAAEQKGHEDMRGNDAPVVDVSRRRRCHGQFGLEFEGVVAWMVTSKRLA